MESRFQQALFALTYTACLGALASVAFGSCDVPQASDWYIEEDCVFIDTEVILPLDTNIIIAENGMGSLTLINTSISLDMSSDGGSEIIVLQNGALALSGNSYLDSLNTYRFAIILDSGSSFELRDSTISNAGWSPSDAERGIEAHGDVDFTISGSTLNNIRSIYLKYVTGALIEDSEFHTSGGSFLEILESAHTVVRDNVFVGDAQYVVMLDSSNSNRFEGNTFLPATTSFSLEGSSNNNLLLDNSFSDSVVNIAHLAPSYSGSNILLGSVVQEDRVDIDPFATGSLDVMEYLFVGVEDGFGAPLDAAEVGLLDGATLLASSPTDSAGLTGRMNLTAFQAGPLGITHPSYTLRVSKTGYSDSTKTFELSPLQITTTLGVTLNESIVDTTAPGVSWVWPDANKTLSLSNETMVVVSTNETASPCILEWDGANQTMSGSEMSWFLLKVLPNGNHTARAYCLDNAGNIGRSTDAWVNVAYQPGDILAPAISLLSPDNGLKTTGENVLFSFKALDDKSNNMNCSLYFGEVVRAVRSSVQSNVQITMTLQSLDEGVISWFVRCWDGSYTGHSMIQQVFVDKTGPRITLRDPANASTIHSDWEMDLSIGDSSGVDEVWWSDGGSSNPLASPYDINPDWDTDGTYWLTVWANDTLGNLMRSVFTFILDDTSPDLMIDESDISLPKTIYEEDEVEIKVTVWNLGEEDAEDFVVTLKVDGKKRSEVLLSVEGNSKNKTSFSWIPREDDDEITVEVDSDDDIDESLEDNNEATRKVKVKPMVVVEHVVNQSAETESTTLESEENASEGGDNESALPEVEVFSDRKDMVVAVTGSMQDGSDFTVLVLDLEGTPLGGAQIDYAGQSLLTGPDGRALVSGVYGSSEVVIKKTGYKTVTRQVAVMPTALTATREKAEPTGDVTKAVDEEPEEFKLSQIMIIAFMGLVLVAFVFYRKEKPPRYGGYGKEEKTSKYRGFHGGGNTRQGMDELKRMIKGGF